MAAGLGWAFIACFFAGAACRADITTFHHDPLRTGWNNEEPNLTPASVASVPFGLKWESPALDVQDGLPPRLYAAPLYMDKVDMSAGEYKDRVLAVVFAATSNGFVYAINASEGESTPPGAILWKTELVRFTRAPNPFDGVNMGVMSTPVINAARKILYVVSSGPNREWKVYAIDITNGNILPDWPFSITHESLIAAGINTNEPPPGEASAPAASPPPAPTAIEPAGAKSGRSGRGAAATGARRAQVLGTQRGALSLSPDGTRLYVTFGESPSGWIVAVATTKPRLVTAFASVASNRTFSGGIWAPTGASLDEQGNVFVSTGTNFGGFKPQARDWTQSVVKLSGSKTEGLILKGTYTPFNHAVAAAADIDLGSGGVCIIPALNPARTATPYLLALSGKQGNIYLVNRERMPGRLDQRPPADGASDTDLSLLSPAPQPQFGKRGPINLFGPYTEKTAAVEQARSRSVPAYFLAADGTSYLFAVGHSKATADSTVNVPPCLARLKIVETPGQPAYLEVDQTENTLIFQNPGHPVVTSSGSQGAIVWVLDENATRSTSLSGEKAPHPVLYAIDALTLKLLWKSRPNELYTSGKYNEPTVARGTVFVGTDRIQAFGLRKNVARAPQGGPPRGSAKALSAVAAPPPPPSAPIDGGELFHSGGSCATCHQENGMGIPGVFPPLVDSEWVSGSEDRLIRIVLHGLQGNVRVAGKDYGVVPMPAFGEVKGTLFNWNDEKVAAVLSYVRKAWGQGAPPIDAKKVSAIRAASGEHPAWTQEQLQELR